MMNYCRLLITFVLLLFLVFPNVALADTVLTVTPGLNGLYKTNQPVQLKINIANNGPAIENAVLMVMQDNKSPQYQPENGAIYQKKINLPANQRFETEIIIPGNMANYNSLVYLIANDLEIAKEKIQGMAVSGEFIGISVGEDPLANGLPIWLETNMKNMVTLKYMTPNEVPANPIILGTADLMVIDEKKVTDLSQEQVATIHQWVTLGGTLLLSGGGGAIEGQPFADISPILRTGTTTLSGNWNGIRSSTASIDVATGTFVDGEKLLTVNDVTLVARRAIGRGTVVYSAVGLQNIAAKDDKIWEALLKWHNEPVMVAKYRGNTFGSLLNASANIPQLQLPSIGYLVGIWGLYIVLVAPGMYLLLKRYNRRDWAWLCVPVMAVLTAGVIYYSAPLHKLNGPLGQTLAVVDVLNKNVSEIRADGSYVSPRGGELVLTDASHGLITPRVRYNGNNNWEQAPIIEYSEKGIEAIYDKVGFLSLRQASLYKVVNDFGHIDGELQLSGSNITGQLTNRTKTNIEKCLVVFGDNAVEIGKIPANGNVHIDVDVMTAKRFNWDTDIRDWFGGVDSTYRLAEEYAQTKRAYSESENYNGIQLIALAKEVPGLMQLKDVNAENLSSALVMQKLPLVFSDNGKFRLPPGFIPANIIDSNGGIEYTPEGYMIHGEKVTLEFNMQLPVQYREVEVQAVEISKLLAESDYQLSIFDWTKNSWVDIKPNQSRLEGKALKPFISENNRLRLNIQRSENLHDVMPVPGLTVEGVVK